MPDRVPPVPNYKEWGPFLRDVDQHMREQVVLHCLGGFVLRVLYDIPRHTGDLDYLEALPAPARRSLEEVAGPQSRLAQKHGLCVHFAGMIDMPENYETRLTELTGDLKHVRLLVPDVYDLLLSKLTRNSPKDRDDVKYVIRRENLDFERLRARFHEEMRPAAGNPQSHELTLELWKDFFPPGSFRQRPSR